MSEAEIIKLQEDNQASLDKKAIEKLKKDYFVHEASNLLKALTVLGR
jgi:carboxyl-terminal processing protease